MHTGTLSYRLGDVTKTATHAEGGGECPEEAAVSKKSKISAEARTVLDTLALPDVCAPAVEAALETYEPSDITPEIVEAYEELV